MKYNKYIIEKLSALILIVTAGLFAACDDDISVGDIDDNNYITSEKNVGYVINAEGKRQMTMLEFRETGSTTLYLSLTKATAQGASATFKYDQSVLDNYNKEYESDYKAFPQNLTHFEGGGTVSIESGKEKSNGAVLNFLSEEELDINSTYVIPISVEVQSGDIELSKDMSSFLVFVKDMSKLPDANKSTGIKIISCMEVNDTNPLNNLCFTLQDSGKQLIDILIMFSANINYNPETGRVYVYNNPNVQHLLDNREKYLKPLQDRGMKVVLGILGNHDRAGVANLADDTAREFAIELKAVCDAYKLDGIFYDDEYSDYMYPAPPGFVSPSSTAAARLCYETKRAMPDRLVCAYVYGATGYFPNPVDGVYAGDFVDYGIHDYGNGSDLSNAYPGMPKSGMALYSQEYNRGYFVSEHELYDIRSKGYGAHMIFAMDPLRSNFSWGQLPSMEDIANVLFDDRLVYDRKPFAKDW